MKLNHPGIYRVVGEHYELLANVIGEVPCLRIPSALLMNDLVQKGKFTVLKETDIEVQNVLLHPENFVFIEYEYSDICSLPSYRKSIHGAKIPDITDEQLKDFTNRLCEDRFENGRGIGATKMYIMDKTSWSLGQINVLILELCKQPQVKMYEYKQPY